MSGSDPHNQPDETMIDLLIKQVTEGLSPDEQRALDVLDSAVASAHLRELERAAAAIAVAGSAGAERPPQELLQRLQRQAEQHFGAATGAAQSAGSAAPNVLDLAAARRRDSTPAWPRASVSGAYGWLAAAACLVLAVFAWNRQPPAPATVVQVPPVHMPPVVVKTEPPPPPSVAKQRAALLAKADSLKITLGATKDPGAAGMSGDVVWDPATQRGFIRFVGLAPNDPAVHQYQLWIFDGARDKRYPVDGGVFDIPANAAGEVVIPIHAALQVIAPKAFAVTVEKPGGVVVSGRDHVVALGAVG
jgi:hypothetical protein